MSIHVLLVGAGPMAVDYAKVLIEMNVPFTAVGRGAQSASAFERETGINAVVGGLEAYLSVNPGNATHAIVAVGEKDLGQAAKVLLQYGVPNLLIEKPGGFDLQEIREVADLASLKGSKVYVGYNRRFYASVRKAKELIRADGGVRSFSFEFTEWGHIVSGLQKAPGVLEGWFLHNSTHVIDMAFHLGGEPSEMICYAAGGAPWHPAATVFSGAGKTADGALFSYQANWEAPGRWGVEVLTDKHRYIFRPLEQLHVQRIGSVQINKIELDDPADERFKPGLSKQVEEFLGDAPALLPIDQQVKRVADYYNRILLGR